MKRVTGLPSGLIARKLTTERAGSFQKIPRAMAKLDSNSGLRILTTGYLLLV